VSKDKYKVRNWHQYNEGLKKRGSLTLWIKADISKAWRHRHTGSRRRGGQLQYSQLAIELCLTLRKVYNLPLRQTEGFISSIFAQSGMVVSVPDYSTLCRRSGNLKVDIRSSSAERITDIVVDSTGLKVYGEGEWKVRRYGAGKHRTWMKLHIAADGSSQQIEALSLTPNSVDDSSAAEGLMKQVNKPVKKFIGDGGYDRDKVRKMLYKRKIKQVIPPQHNARIDKKQRAFRKQRDRTIQTISAVGKDVWKKQQGYHERSKAETVMFRYKTIIGGYLRSRKLGHQQTEAAIGCKILNIMLQIAKPKSVKVA
jgi:IS5 family transposase